MVVEDIGYMIFVEFLRMTAYPGTPFTGEIMRDLVLFFFIPTVFIILVVYMLLGRILPTAHKKLRVLLGVALYLFIIFGGYYPAFAYLAGPYFIFLIFIMGILYYFVEHFTRRKPPGGGPHVYEGSSGHYVRTGDYIPSYSPHFENMSRQELHDERERIEIAIKGFEDQLREAERHGETRNEDLRKELARLRSELQLVENELKYTKGLHDRFRF